MGHPGSCGLKMREMRILRVAYPADDYIAAGPRTRDTQDDTEVR